MAAHSKTQAPFRKTWAVLQKIIMTQVAADKLIPAFVYGYRQVYYEVGFGLL
jgi:hypothetical protein